MVQREEVIENFREYLKIPSVHPDPDYDPCVAFLRKKAEEYGLATKVLHLDEKRPVLIATLEGSQPGLPSILLNSHMDVVPVYKAGIPAIGFSPFNRTTVLLHAHNEYLNKDIFMKGISIYEKLIANVANA